MKPNEDQMQLPPIMAERRPQRDEPGPRRPLLWAVLALVVLGLAALAAVGIMQRSASLTAVRQETAHLAVTTVAVTKPKRGAATEDLVLPANIQPFTTAPIYARTGGYLRKWHADIGTSVKAGQLLAEIEAPELDQQLQQARADASTAQVNFDTAQSTATRYRGLLASNAVSRQETEAAVGDFEARRSALKSARINVKRLEELHGLLRITAPFDGVVTARNTDVGALVEAGGAPGRELFRMAAIDRLRVFVNVPQTYSRDTRPGLVADLTLQQFPGRKFKATLTRTSEAIDPATRTLLVEFGVDNPGHELLTGSFGEMHLKLAIKEQSWVLPVNALLFRSNGVQVALVQDGSRIALQPVTLGRDFGKEIEVVTGLKGDESVVVNPPDSIASGDTVRVLAEKPPAAPAAEGQKPAADGQKPAAPAPAPTAR